MWNSVHFQDGLNEVYTWVECGFNYHLLHRTVVLKFLSKNGSEGSYPSFGLHHWTHIFLSCSGIQYVYDSHEPVNFYKLEIFPGSQAALPPSSVFDFGAFLFATAQTTAHRNLRREYLPPMHRIWLVPFV